MAELTKIMKDFAVSTGTEVRLLQIVVLVFPAVLYVCKNWTLRKADNRKFDAFELWM